MPSSNETSANWRGEYGVLLTPKGKGTHIRANPDRQTGRLRAAPASGDDPSLRTAVAILVVRFRAILPTTR